MSVQNPFIVAVIATYRRPAELRRLLDSLVENAASVGAVIVADNAADSQLREVFPATLDVEWLSLPENLGCGGGLARGAARALEKFGDRLTHVLYLDDDVVLPPNAVAELAAALDRCGADVACPMTQSANGGIDFHPGLLERRKHRVVRSALTPAMFAARCGTEPVRFSWTTGVCLLVTRRALDERGFHRADYWLRGEDLEYSLRLTSAFAGVFVPGVVVKHLPPEPVRDAAWRRGEFRRHCALVQNTTFSATHLPHCRTLLRSMPGTYRRFFATWGFSKWSLRVAWRLFRAGAIEGVPAGVRLGILKSDEP